MTNRQKKRLYLALFITAGAAATAALTLNAFQQNLLFFLSPTQVSNGESSANRPFRLGGMVAEGSVVRGEGLLLRFIVTDFNRAITVQYAGVLPDLFREGQGVVAKGKMQDGLFLAEEILAKHDENYMPPEIKESLYEKPR